MASQPMEYYTALKSHEEKYIAIWSRYFVIKQFMEHGSIFIKCIFFHIYKYFLKIDFSDIGLLNYSKGYGYLIYIYAKIWSHWWMYTYVDSQWFLGQWGLILPSFSACIYITKLSAGASLAVQWVRFHTLNAKAWIQSLARELRSYMPYGPVKKLYKSTKMAYYFCIIKKKQGCFVSCKKFEVMLGMIKAGLDLQQNFGR